jgi:DNA repair protein RecN (Recombination protein N)
MLQHLSIKNYALIDHLELSFYDGFSVITGETGAGKSIMLNALSLILGKRADLKSIKKQDAKCIVEGTFKLNPSQNTAFFDQNDLDFEEFSILRREITPSGKSRAFINDTPVTLDLLGALAERLIDVHSQHQNLLLTNVGFQLDLLDSFAGNEKIKTSYAAQYQAYKALKKQLQELQEKAQNEAGDGDYLQFLLEELLNANLQAGEQEEIEQELQVAENAEEIQQNLSASLHLLEDGSSSAIEQLKQVRLHLGALLLFDSEMSHLQERVESSRIELDDIVQELKIKLNGIEADPNRTTQLDTRLSLLINLQRKHQATSIDELITKRDALDEKIESQTGIESKIQTLESELKKAEDQLSKVANELFESRKRIVPSLEDEIKALLTKLNMAESEFCIDLLKTDAYSERGNVKIDFLFSANKGLAPAKLSKVASGGELSRVMLSLKAIMAQTQSLPSIIFDEVDTGVSGETAGKIGDILKGMGNHMQVIAISHLPQIASSAKYHYKVSKYVENNVSRTHIKELEETERLTELARLLSGEQISDAALENARQLLQQQE